MSEARRSFGQLLVAGLLSGSVIAGVLSLVTSGYQARTEEAIRAEFAKIVFTRDWKEQSLAKVVGPVVMHLDRTARVAQRYRNKPVSYFDARIMRDSNEKVRSILLTNGHLIPQNLRDHAHRLVEHYDVWIRRFDEKVERERPTQDTPFDVGFASPGFPEDAKIAFEDSYVSLRDDLYGE